MYGNDLQLMLVNAHLERLSCVEVISLPDFAQAVAAALLPSQQYLDFVLTWTAAVSTYALFAIFTLLLLFASKPAVLRRRAFLHSWPLANFFDAWTLLTVTRCAVQASSRCSSRSRKGGWRMRLQ
eukprot:TRINITY_DN31687_c0_g1_i1.p2 TRINITY_DN31687_c0_g1~~TRINITY_DN31687_c0_g1_i1.p2  ORF type:complete len:125 (+),score=4.78 TRINITY_DN31687_c0_g1_i1:1242-1616(+)